MQPCNGVPPSTFSIPRIAMVEADEGIGMIPSFGLPACRNRKVLMSRLINALVNLEFCPISNRGKKLPPAQRNSLHFLEATSPDAGWADEVLAALVVFLKAVPGWRNWQTRRTQNPVTARSCRFDSYARHHSSMKPVAASITRIHEMVVPMVLGPAGIYKKP
jgi:hypothetical protein